MTIKIRNRITTFFFFFTIVYLAFATILTAYQIFTKNLVIPEVFVKNVPTQKIITNNPIAVIVTIFISMVYVSSTTFSIKQNFEKTQATDMIFFLMFLFGMLCDTARLFIPLLRCTETYSNFLIALANVTLFGRILAPISIAAAIIISSDDYAQNADQNCLIILIAALFFANLIPINTAKILPNFTVSYGFSKLLRTFSVIIFIIGIISLFIKNQKSEYSQKSTLGLTFICTGYLIATNGYSILTAILAPLFLLFGTHFYMATIHRQYLWID